MVAWITAHWAQLGLVISEIMGLAGIGGVAATIVNGIWPPAPKA